MFKKIVAAGAAVVGAVGSAVAAVPADVTTALSEMKTDALIVGAAFVVAVIAIKALGMLKRA